MAKPYLTQNDCSLRLHKTVCTYKGEPVFVQCYLDDKPNVVSLTLINPDGSLRKKPLTINIEEPDFIITSPELGYVNFDKTAGYYIRNAVRRAQQGLNHSSIYLVNAGEVRELDPIPQSFFATPGFHGMWTNNYPSLHEACAYVEALVKNTPKDGFQRTYSRAFHKQLCVRTRLNKNGNTEPMKVVFQNNPIGVVTSDLKIKLNSNFLQDSDRALLMTSLLTSYGVQIHG